MFSPEEFWAKYLSSKYLTISTMWVLTNREDHWAYTTITTLPLCPGWILAFSIALNKNLLISILRRGFQT